MAFDNRQKDRNLIRVSIIAMLWLPNLCSGVGNSLTAQPVNTPPATTSNQPPIEQTLIPQGVFAKQLAEALQLDSAIDEQQAEALLSRSGIEPKNGWINDYPVTPAVLGDIEIGLTAAGNQGKLGADSAQAVKLLDELEKRLGLAVKPEQSRQASQPLKKGNTTVYSYTDKQGRIFYTDNYDSIPQEYRDKTKIIGQSAPQTTGYQTAETGYQPNQPNLDPSIIDSYYNNPGPPVLTYYPPPDPYLYLYSWIPYSFSSYGYYFPGYFMLNNFYRHVYYNRQPYVISRYGAGTGFNSRLAGIPRFPVGNFSNPGSFQTKQIRPYRPYQAVSPGYRQSFYGRSFNQFPSYALQNPVVRHPVYYQNAYPNNYQSYRPQNTFRNSNFNAAHAWNSAGHFHTGGGFRSHWGGGGFSGHPGGGSFGGSFGGHFGGGGFGGGRHH